MAAIFCAVRLAAMRNPASCVSSAFKVIMHHAGESKQIDVGNRMMEAPLKLLAKDLERVTVNRSHKYPWKIQFLTDNPNSRAFTVEFSQVWIQGSVKKKDDDGDSVLINDGSGDIQVMKCSRAPGDRSWISSGAYCGVLACAKMPSKLPPEVEAVKLMHISERKNEAECMWPLEVQELANFLKGNVIFKL